MTDPNAGESVGSISACQVNWGDDVLEPDVDLGEGYIVISAVHANLASAKAS